MSKAVVTCTAIGVGLVCFGNISPLFIVAGIVSAATAVILGCIHVSRS